MADQSELDSLYFVSEDRYNCPYCNRRHVIYRITGVKEFDWTDKKKCWAIFVRCESCGNESMHLTHEKITDYSEFKGYFFNKMNLILRDKKLDNYFFYSVPSSYHVINDHIPRVLRELLAEAQGCLKSNFLTGASACVRKVVYELAALQKAEGLNYDERIKGLKKKMPGIDPDYFDSLLAIQRVTSDKVHEESYDGWEGKHLKLIIAGLVEALHEIYVVPKEREKRKAALIELQGNIIGDKKGK